MPPAPHARLAFLAGGSTLVFLLLLYGAASLVSWRRAKLAEATPQATSPPTVKLQNPSTPLGVNPLPPEAVEELVRLQSRPDTDADGLTDDLEWIHGTNPNNADTDGDGYEDGLEIANGYDPKKPSPGDKILSPQFPATPAPETYTQQFAERTGILSDDPRDLLKNEELGPFVAEVNARGFLPDVPDSELVIVADAGKEAVARYLDTVSTPQNPRLQPVSGGEIALAFRALTSTNDERPLQDIAAKVAGNLAELKKAPVPGEALALHRQFVAATLALGESTKSLLAYRNDLIGALVAASRIENLGGVFRAVGEGIRALETKYNIT